MNCLRNSSLANSKNSIIDALRFKKIKVVNDLIKGNTYNIKDDLKKLFSRNEIKWNKEERAWQLLNLASQREIKILAAYAKKNKTY